MSPLKVSALTRRFGGLQALDNVSIELEPGERRAIIGTNGAGKTTLFNVIMGELPASSGTIELFGRDVTRLPMHSRAALGLNRTFQITSLFPNLTVFENLLIAVQALAPTRFVFWRKARAYAASIGKVETLLRRSRLWEARHDLVRTLSYGVQRQLEIVLALAGEPKLLLLDEPTAGLSAAETHLAADLILGLDRAITILLIEHDITTAFRIADRVTAMDQGRIVAEGTPDEIRRAESMQRIYHRGRSARQ